MLSYVYHVMYYSYHVMSCTFPHRVYHCLGNDGTCCVSGQDLLPFVWGSVFCLSVCHVVLPYTSRGLCEYTVVCIVTITGIHNDILLVRLTRKSVELKTTITKDLT